MIIWAIFLCIPAQHMCAIQQGGLYETRAECRAMARIYQRSVSKEWTAYMTCKSRYVETWR